MRIRAVVLIALALSIAGGTALLVRARLNTGQPVARPAEPSKARLQILVAKTDLPIGQFIKADQLRWQAWPAESVAPAYIKEGARPLEDFLGTVPRQVIAAGEPITESRVVSPGNAGFLAAVLQPGMRAVSVPVTITSGISGFVFPGDHVDLILTHIIPQPQAAAQTVERRASETVLEDIRVLAIDQKVDAKAGETLVARTATLEVTPKQSEIVAVVVEMGKLSLSLRSFIHEPADNAVLVGGNFGAAPVVPGNDSPAIRGRTTFTLDNDVSRLLPPQGRGAAVGHKVAVLRGSGKAEERELP